MYDYHGKDCPRCQRTLKRASLIERRARQAKRIFLIGSAMLAMVASSLGKKLTVPFLGLIASVASHWIESMMRKAKEAMHLPMDIDAIDDIYAF